MVTDRSNDLSSEFFAKMVESVGVGVGIYGQDGRYIYVNQSYAELFNVSPSELIGKPLWEIVPEIDATKFDGYWASFDERRGGTKRYTSTIIRKFLSRQSLLSGQLTARPIILGRLRTSLNGKPGSKRFSGKTNGLRISQASSLTTYGTR